LGIPFKSAGETSVMDGIRKNVIEKLRKSTTPEERKKIYKEIPPEHYHGENDTGNNSYATDDF
jgi:hypothetical protein